MSAYFASRVVAVAVFATLGVAGTASAANVNVHPGNNAIQKAIDNRASNGDTLRLHGGRYKEDVDVDKKVTITEFGDGTATIDGECEAGFVVDVDRNGVVLEDFKVVGASDNVSAAEVNFDGIAKGTARDLTLRDTCGAGAGNGAGYGVNVYNSERILVEGVNAKGFSDAGVYIGLITTTGPGELNVRDNTTFGNAQGIIIEEVESDADVLVEENFTHDNGKGIFVHVSDAVLFRGQRHRRQQRRNRHRLRVGRQRVQRQHAERQRRQPQRRGHGKLRRRQLTRDLRPLLSRGPTVSRPWRSSRVVLRCSSRSRRWGSRP